MEEPCVQAEPVRALIADKAAVKISLAKLYVYSYTLLQSLIEGRPDIISESNWHMSVYYRSVGVNSVALLRAGIREDAPVKSRTSSCGLDTCTFGALH